MGKSRTQKSDECKVSQGAEGLIYAGKISKAFASCEIYVKKSIVASKSEGGEFDILMWHAAAELEYVLFLFSLRDEDENITLDRKTESHGGKNSPAESLRSVKDLITSSKELIFKGKWVQARSCAYSARNILLRIQREHSRKKRKSSSCGSHSSSI